jgi:lipopolysaccharide transport system ATP-binding protein
MSDVAISVRNLSKMYKIYQRPIDLLFDLAGLKGKPYKEFWALKDISFEIKRGEVVGLIGKNGSGKSTLLKILANTLDKTSGHSEVHGSLSAILELGTGFNPELSGRDNVMIGGMCLGMPRAVVKDKMESIIDFSGLRDVIDQPFKTYSSGMQARLTFSTAIAIDPDILIVDEALAAGDAFFVSKSMKRIDEICRSGATVLFVSHSLNLVERFCSRVIRLNDGVMTDIGDTRRICKEYELEILKEQQAEVQTLIETKIAATDRVGIGGVYTEAFRILDEDQREVSTLRVGKRYVFEIDVEVEVDMLEFLVNVSISNSSGGTSFSVNSGQYISASGDEDSTTFRLNKGRHRLRLVMHHLWLGRGEYYVSISLLPHLKISLSAESYDYVHMRWFFNVEREGLIQWVHYEQPVSFENPRPLQPDL